MQPDQIRQRIDELLQKSPFASLSTDVKLLLQGQLNSLFSKANLVSREEFDIQTEALRRTEQKLVALEQQITALEAQAQSTTVE